MKYKISQSSLKNLEDADNCPFRWNQVHIKKSISGGTFPSALGGKYFEYMALGTDTGATDMPRLKSGKKSTEQLRIEKQADLFKAMHDPESESYLGYNIIGRNITISNKDSKGIVDYIVEEEATGSILWMDLKMVLALGGGYYNYENHEDADYTQQIFYKRIMNDIGSSEDNLGLSIFEKGKSARVKFISPIEISEESVELLSNRIETAYVVINAYNELGWTKYPSQNECDKCPLSCDKRFVKDTEEDKVEDEPEKTLEMFEQIKINI